MGLQLVSRISSPQHHANSQILNHFQETEAESHFVTAVNSVNAREIVNVEIKWVLYIFSKPGLAITGFSRAIYWWNENTLKQLHPDLLNLKLLYNNSLHLSSLGTFSNGKG